MLRINPRCFAEALLRLTVIESVVEGHSLLEEALRLRTRSLHRVVNLAETLGSADGGGARGGGMIVLLRSREGSRATKRSAKWRASGMLQASEAIF